MTANYPNTQTGFSRTWGLGAEMHSRLIAMSVLAATLLATPNVVSAATRHQVPAVTKSYAATPNGDVWYTWADCKDTAEGDIDRVPSPLGTGVGGVCFRVSGGARLDIAIQDPMSSVVAAGYEFTDGINNWLSYGTFCRRRLNTDPGASPEF